jgi:serine/threonine protein kinase
MTAERFRQIRNVFDAAMEQNDSERAAWLADACQGDESLVAEVNGLLQQHQKRSGVLDAPAAGIAELAAAQRLEGRRLGAWEVLREIGRGGMGVVYLARRADGAFQMPAAIKVLSVPFADDETRKRFRQEREILAQLSHPNIARLLDGGTTEEGLPYLVMEYVDGQTLTTWCDEQRAPTDVRLRLLEQLCEVVHYLHEHGVIHRDLKPANVLVSADGTLKLLDFGIAKLLGPIGDQTVLATRSGLHLLTPEYASPEQVRGEAITPQTDIYALGAIAYELLTGRRPYRLRSRLMHEVLRAICEEEPERPSTAVLGRDEEAKGTETEPWTISRLRRLTPLGLSKILRGDLDEVLMKALLKAPSGRYSTALELAEDLAAHGEGKPVLARGNSGLTRTWHILNRYRMAVVLAIAAVVLIATNAVTVHVSAILYTVLVLLVLGLWNFASDHKLRQRIGKLMQRMDEASRSVQIAFGVAAGLIFLGLDRVSGGKTIFILFFAVSALFCLERITRRLLGQRRAGEIILDTSKRRSKFFHVVNLFSICLWIFLGLWSNNRVYDWPFQAFMILSQAWTWLVADRLRLRQNGILGGILIPWDEVESWGWQHHERWTVMRIKRRRRGWLSFLPPTRIRVASARVAEVTRVMSQLVGEANAPAPVAEKR